MCGYNYVVGDRVNLKYTIHCSANTRLTHARSPGEYTTSRLITGLDAAGIKSKQHAQK